MERTVSMLVRPMCMYYMYCNLLDSTSNIVAGNTIINKKKLNSLLKKHQYTDRMMAKY